MGVYGFPGSCCFAVEFHVSIGVVPIEQGNATTPLIFAVASGKVLPGHTPTACVATNEFQWRPSCSPAEWIEDMHLYIPPPPPAPCAHSPLQTAQGGAVTSPFGAMDLTSSVELEAEHSITMPAELDSPAVPETVGHNYRRSGGRSDAIMALSVGCRGTCRQCGPFGQCLALLFAQRGACLYRRLFWLKMDPVSSEQQHPFRLCCYQSPWS